MRIIYGVASEGMGHATRSNAVIERLLKHGHDVHIVTSDRAYDFFLKKGFDVHCVKGFHLVYEENKLSSTKSVIWNVKHLPKGFVPSIDIVAQLFDCVKPDVVISDFEFFTAFYGKATGVPVVSANNISIVDKTRVGLSRSTRRHKWWTGITAKLATVRADWYVIPTFFFPKIKGRNIILTNPVVREAVTRTKPKKGKHILVYQTSPTCLPLLQRLKKLPEKFIVYGFGAKPKDGNLQFQPFNETRFIKHLATAKAVITGGGFSLISEALYLKKPILSVPLHDHFEQIMNGHYIEQLGYGEHNIEPTPDDVRLFLSRLHIYKRNLDNYDFDPTEFARTVEEVAMRIAKEPNPKRLRRIANLIRNL